MMKMGILLEQVRGCGVTEVSYSDDILSLEYPGTSQERNFVVIVQ